MVFLSRHRLEIMVGSLLLISIALPFTSTHTHAHKFSAPPTPLLSFPTQFPCLLLSVSFPPLFSPLSRLLSFLLTHLVDRGGVLHDSKIWAWVT